MDWLVLVLQFYGYLSQQQNMMQDYVRTGTYQRAILQNHTDFKDKVPECLELFAAQACDQHHMTFVMKKLLNMPL